MSIKRNPKENFRVQRVWRDDGTIAHQRDADSLDDAIKICGEMDKAMHREDTRFNISSVKIYTTDALKKVRA